ncbi:branched-chain amino acid aminotransferase [Rhodobium orientis]|uniref:Probable branched-chain-amino-acid aminotransferase n=1 Tax=Rhodobium orientis TaxID=34017 RepID=A0A327JML1_9HYPH|nr:branched-chain amino acid aminotransferase [Rhodobium orientis]MBB4303810.1 branched-chain amino acid aminotransferase [Rhodobium orientis]MBK5947928.1 branched chain amino acid aminotransferase [Rhodobium orientis]RAI26092.1 branched chain amino acid aminotransferase [Rhodobium orientis]
MADWSQTWTWIDGGWIEGNPPIIGPRTHAAWLGSTVFDGARVFEGVAPDLDRHCARLNDSAVALGLKPVKEVGEMVELTHEGAAKFAPDAAIYVRPTYWAERGGPFVVAADPESTRFCLCLFEVPMPPQGKTTTVTKTRFRRPTIETMPVNAKAACLYPNNARMLNEAHAKGFDNALALDMLGNVAELATANVFMVRDGTALTPVPNGTFLNGITRQRIIALLRGAGITVAETTLTYDDFLGADEIFSTGNISKVVPVSRIDERELQPGPIAKMARDLYWDFAHAGG